MSDSELPASVTSMVPELAKLESLLTCPICKERLDLPATTPCHHTFCSICIRKALEYKKLCPHMGCYKVCTLYNDISGACMTARFH